MESRLPVILREYRLKHELSQRELAETLNTDQSYISRIERGERPRKNSDIDFLMRVSNYLSIAPEELGLLGETPTVPKQDLSREMLEAWGSVLGLADSVRGRGDPETAIKSVSPIVSALERKSEIEPGGPTTELLVRAKLVLGTALGDRLPTERLGGSLRHLKEARDAVNPDDRDLKVQILRAYGNELRKNGQARLALESLYQARALLPNSAINGSLAIALARAEAEVQNWKGFRDSIADARRALDEQMDSRPLFNSLVVHEVVLRGLLAQDDSRGVARELAVSIAEPSNLAAQWRAIYLVTMAEAYLFTGEVALGAETAEKALAAAKELRLPQQIKRMRDVLSRYRKQSGAVADGFDTAQRLVKQFQHFRL